MLEPVCREHLTTCGEHYARHSGVKLGTVARRFAGDTRFFERIADGATFTLRMYDTMMGKFAAAWPTDLPWPVGVPLPGGRFEVQTRAGTARQEGPK